MVGHTMIEELEDWKQAARVEANLRREFLERAINAEAELADAIKERDALVKALERIIDADTTISDGGKVHDHGSSAAIAIEALRGISVGRTREPQ